MKKTLEAKTRKQERTIDRDADNLVSMQCSANSCRKPLLVSADVWKKIDEARQRYWGREGRHSDIFEKQHDGVYISSFGMPYCSEECAVRFTEG